MGRMYSCYRALSRALSPFLKAYFYCRCPFGKDEKKSVQNHFGIPTIERPTGRLIWIHAASIGEANSAFTYIKHLKENHPDVNVLLTTITLTSANLLRDKIKMFSGCYHQFVVADVPGWIKKFLDFWQPEKAIFLESEIWPNIIHELRKRNIPMYLLNARLSDRSFRRWRWLSGCMHDILSNFDVILAQSKEDAEKFSTFGTSNVVQIDNLKYANSVLSCDDNLLNVFRSFCARRRVFVAASTHQGEEEIIFQAHKLMNEKIPVTTIIIPRHVNRISQIKELCAQLGLRCTLRSEAVKGRLENSEIFLVDTYGEVGTFFRLAHMTFVGGSLVNIGGHNILEPAALGKIVLHGPYMSNFIEITRELHRLNVAYEVKTAEEIIRICLKMFDNLDTIKYISENMPDKIRNKSLEQIDGFIKIQKNPIRRPSFCK